MTASTKMPIFAGGLLGGPPAKIPSVLVDAGQVGPDGFVLAGANYACQHGKKAVLAQIVSGLVTMYAVLQNLAEKDDDQIDPLAKDWQSKLRELSYDIEDRIDRFRLNHSHGASKANYVRKAVGKVKVLLQDQGLAEEIQKLKRLVIEQSK